MGIYLDRRKMKNGLIYYYMRQGKYERLKPKADLLCEEGGGGTTCKFLKRKRANLADLADKGNFTDIMSVVFYFLYTALKTFGVEVIQSSFLTINYCLQLVILAAENKEEATTVLRAALGETISELQLENKEVVGFYKAVEQVPRIAVTLRIDEKGRITLPSDAMKKLGVAPSKWLALDFEEMRLSANEIIQPRYLNEVCVTVLNYDGYKFIKKFKDELLVKLQTLVGAT